jgi:hypothetical protein
MLSDAKPARTPHPAGDGCDTKLTIANAPRRERQARFLAAFAETWAIARAARVAGVSRCQVYHWIRADPDFAAAMRATAEARFAEHRERVMAEQAARVAWRRAREQDPERHAMRCENLARARAMRGR